MVWSDADLRAAVEALAAPPEEQLAHARTLPSWPLLDEMALEFADEFERVRGEPSQGDRGPYVAALQALDDELDAISGEQNERLWLPEALNGPEWARIRELAAQALRLAPPPAPGPDDLTDPGRDR